MGYTVRVSRQQTYRKLAGWTEGGGKLEAGRLSRWGQLSNPSI